MTEKTIFMALLLVICSSFVFQDLQPRVSAVPDINIPPYFLNSSKIIDANGRKLLYQWVNLGNPRTHLLWRGSEAGFNWANMHQKVDNWGPIIVVVKTPEQYTFGGYISISLNVSAGELAFKDPKAFIFSLTKGTVHYQRDKTMTSIFNSKQYISFGHRYGDIGNWDDISIRYSCNVDFWSYSDFGYHFIPPSNIQPGSKEAQTYMAGNYRWKCVDIEIWGLVEA